MHRALLIGIALLFGTPSAYATLIGDDITILRLFDPAGTELSTPGTEPSIEFASASVVDNGPFTAVDGDDGIVVQRTGGGTGAPLYTIDLQSDAIIFTGLNSSFGSNPSDPRFNGFSFSGFSGQISSVSAFNGTPGINGFNDDDVWVVNNVVYLNTMGSGSLGGTTFGVNVTFAPVPAPASAALLLAGFALVSLRRRAR